MRTHQFEKEHFRKSQKERFLEGQYNVCGVVLNTHPDHLEEVITIIKSYEGCDIVNVEKTGQIGLTIEDTEEYSSYDVMDLLQRQDEVLSISITSHYFE